jgi:hypothetical protein
VITDRVGIASINRDGTFAFEGTPGGANLAAGILPATATPQERLDALAAYDNYPYAWCEVDSGRSLLSKAIDRVRNA